MIVFRLQKEGEGIFGIGPYQGTHLITDNPENRDLLNKMTEEHSQSGEHPLIMDDLEPITTREEAEYTAFPTANLLEEWFGDYLDPLFEMGFEVMEYNVENYKPTMSGKQLVIREEWLKEVA